MQFITSSSTLRVSRFALGACVALIACREPTESRPRLSTPEFTIATDLTITDLGSLGGIVGEARAVNDLGQVVGTSYTANEIHPFLWQNGTMTDLGTLGGTWAVAGWAPGVARTVNAVGQVVGASTTAGNAETHAFLWQNGTMTDLGTLGGISSQAIAVNALGQVAGWASTPNEAERRPVLWETSLRPPTPRETADILTRAVEELVAAGHLPSGQGNALLSTLNNIKKQLDQGNCKTAKQGYNAFINKLQSYVAIGLISAEDAQPLLNVARDAYNALLC